MAAPAPPLFLNWLTNSPLAITPQVILYSTPVTLTGTSGTIALSNPSIIFNSSISFTATLPDPTVSNGQWLYFKNIAAQPITSASANIVLLTGGAAVTTIITSTAGKWVALQSDGVSWQIMMSN